MDVTRSTPSPEDPGAHSDLLVDADEDRWAWRARIKRNPTTRRLYRVAVAVVGLAIIGVGVVAVPAPGPGWAIIFFGLAVLASEFEKAAAVLHFAQVRVRRWAAWVAAQHRAVRAGIGLATLALVLAVFWVYLAVAGVPTWLPGAGIEALLRKVPGLG